MALRYIALFIGAVLLLGGLGSSMWVSATLASVETWTPFAWCSFLGFIISYNVVPAKGSILLHTLGTILGGLLLATAIGGAMLVSVNPDLSVLTWTPFGWSGALGFLLLWSSLSDSSDEEKTVGEENK